MEKITGYIERIIYRSVENGYTVFEFVSEGDEITCVGYFANITESQHMEITGEYTEHHSYGMQFKVSSFEEKAPQSEIAIERYLASGAIKGIGVALAARIVRRFKKDTFRIIEEEPERLVEVKGISERKAIEIAEQINAKKDLRQAMIFLQQYGIRTNLALKIYKTYGAKLYTILKENPYQMAEDIDGVGFKTADEIASHVGIRTDSDFRIRSGILYALTQASGEGHTYLPQEELTIRASELLGVEKEDIEKHYMNLAMDKKLVLCKPKPKKEKMNFNPKEEAPFKENKIQQQKPLTEKSLLEKTKIQEKEDFENTTEMQFIQNEKYLLQEEELQEEQTQVYASPFFYMEANTATMLKQLDICYDVSDKEIETHIKEIEIQTQITLDEQQICAVKEAIRNGLLIITGGPGTGKTTTINTIIRYFEMEGMDIFLAAPTGRAAKRMSETTGFEARTIHRMLEVNGGVEGSGGFERNEKNPLETDVIIIDEMSMVDISLMYALLKAVLAGTRLILVGDVNQLPSVGAGAVLKDIIDSNQFHVVKLNKIFRQASTSDIIVNAHKINNGEDITLDNKSMDFFFLKRYDVDKIIQVTLQLIKQKLPKYVNATEYDIQVLTPTRKGLLGVERLNGILQMYLNPPSPKKREKEHNHRLFREGDKVMQIKNNYQLEWEIRTKYGLSIDKGMGVFNGDTGIIEEINTFAETMTISFDEGRMVEYPFKLLEELEHAYAITIHKSQGSEYPAVVMPLMAGPRMLMNRNLLYTAVTRAKKCVTIVGDENAFFTMVENNSQLKRYSGLRERLLERDL